MLQGALRVVIFQGLALLCHRGLSHATGGSNHAKLGSQTCQHHFLVVFLATSARFYAATTRLFVSFVLLLASLLGKQLLPPKLMFFPPLHMDGMPWCV